MNIAYKEANIKELTSAIDSASKWVGIIGQKTRGDGEASISIAHCKKPMLEVAGQFHEGGTNYWPSPRELNYEILKVIVEDKSIIERALDSLVQQRERALKDIESDLVSLLEEIRSK